MMPLKVISPGTRFGKLVTTGSVNRCDSRAKWECVCDCGKTHFAIGSDLRNGKILSCGCHRRAALLAANIVHGKTKTREFSIWMGMLKRCENRACNAYKDYGGRGITVCARWREFSNFLEDMGQCPDGYSIERINVDGKYEPFNCVWASRTDQNNNTRRNVVIEFRGKKMTIAQACREVGTRYSRVRDRIHKLGWSVEKALLEQKRVN